MLPFRLLVLALVVAGAGCFSSAVEEEDLATSGPAVWLPGDAWTYRLETSRGTLTDEWVVVGPATWKGQDAIRVRSETTGPNVDVSDLGYFDAKTLALAHVESEGLTLDFDPGEQRLLPAEDRTYRTTITEVRDGRTFRAEASYLIRHRGVETVDTDAGPFAAHRFEVIRTLHSDRGSSEETKTVWWAPAALNVVREDVAGEPVKMLRSWSLANGARIPPPIDP